MKLDLDKLMEHCRNGNCVDGSCELSEKAETGVQVCLMEDNPHYWELEKIEMAIKTLNLN